MKPAARNELKAATDGESFLALCKTAPEWMVASNADANQLADSEFSPWSNVPKAALGEFFDALTFKNGGLAHANYSSLEPHMNVQEFFSMWGHFGIDRELFIKIADKRCASPGTCEHCNSCACTSNC